MRCVQQSLLVVIVIIMGTGAGPMFAAAQDYDGDSVLDGADPCPHIAGATPLAMAGARVVIDYGGNGVPGGGDDQLKVRRVFFVSTASFDPDSADNVHVTTRKNGNPSADPDLHALTLAAGPPWLDFSAKRRKWDYLGPAPGAVAVKARLKEPAVALPGSALYKFRITKVKDTNIDTLTSTDDATVVLEIENTIVPFTGPCFESTVTSCVDYGGKVECKP